MTTKKVGLFASAMTLLLAGCGGGGGGEPAAAAAPAPAPVTLAALAGFWNGAVSGADLGGATKARAVVLGDGSAWLFLHDASTPAEPLVGLAKGTLGVAAGGTSFAGTLRRYPVSGSALGEVALAAAAPAGGQLSATAGATALSLESDARFATPATLAEIAGTWRFTKAAGTIQYTWVVDANGTLTGSSTLGCTYAGQVLPHPQGVAVYDATISESCAGAVEQFAGIAKLNSAKTVATFGLVSADGTEGETLAAEKAGQ